MSMLGLLGRRPKLRLARLRFKLHLGPHPGINTVETKSHWKESHKSNLLGNVLGWTAMRLTGAKIPERHDWPWGWSYPR